MHVIYFSVICKSVVFLLLGNTVSVAPLMFILSSLEIGLWHLKGESVQQLHPGRGSLRV